MEMRRAPVDRKINDIIFRQNSISSIVYPC